MKALTPAMVKALLNAAYERLNAGGLSNAEARSLWAAIRRLESI